MATAILILTGILVLVLAVLWRLKPTKFRFSLKLTSWLHLELESESHEQQ